MVATRDNYPLLAALLAEQQTLDTPVARFSDAHDAGAFVASPPRISSLIPLSQPAAGEQYAFEVDLDSCTGCKACVSACHSLNGLDETEAWRDVGIVVGGNVRRPYQQTVTTACHHCADPACLNGCPVLAYEKDPVTGIVRHHDDQCIGCQYCVLKCPYDVPKYNERLGIVRKCDMCQSRLSAGEAPACAQACPTNAIRIVTVQVSAVAGSTAPIERQDRPETFTGFDTSQFLRAAPDAGYTQPTTRYLSRRPVPENTRAADADALRPQPPHWPLAIMLTLMPVAVGCFASAAAFPSSPPTSSSFPFSLISASPFPAFLFPAAAANPNVTYYVTFAGWLAGAAGLAASVFHLGQPLRAWRIFLGWRRSWLSREAMVFAVWFAIATAALSRGGLVPMAAAVGFAGLFCSAMIYTDTRREFWRLDQTVPRILGSAVLVALAGPFPFATGFLLLLKLTWESRTYFGRKPSARLQQRPLWKIVACRDTLGYAAAFFFIFNPGLVAIALLLACDLADRHLFFRAVDAPKMPGVPA